MKIKSYLLRLETILKRKFPGLCIDTYYSRRRNFVHFAFDRPIISYSFKEDLFKEIERYYEENFKNDFELIKPIKLINTVRWKYDYIVFRKHC